MSPIATRQILRSRTDYRNEVRELLQGIFAAELLAPSRCLWLVSPWIRDIDVLDNASGAFWSLDPDLPQGGVRLAEVLRRLVQRGTHVVIATRPEVENLHFVESIREAVRGRAIDDALTVAVRDVLHAKGLLGDLFCVSGSMNFTFHGIDVQTELLNLQVDPAQVAQLRVQLHSEYGGRL